MQSTLDEKDWNIIIKRIHYGKCTPFLGAGACYGLLPLAKELAMKWAEEYKYPLTDCEDLPHVAQFLAVTCGDNMYPKEEIINDFKAYPAPDFKNPDELHGILADLPISVYITTNYDDFMVKALKSRNKNPKLELCLWNKYIKEKLPDYKSIFETKPDFVPNPDNPVVFHLHGHWDVPESLVLTEDDYLDFLVNISRDPTLLPPPIHRALGGSSLLFIGYRMADTNFRVLLRGIISTFPQALRRISVSVQFPKPKQKKAETYITKYYKTTEVDIRVYWGAAKEFAAELKNRWNTFFDQNRERSKNE